MFHHQPCGRLCSHPPFSAVQSPALAHLHAAPCVDASTCAHVLPALQALHHLICAHYLKKDEQYLTVHLELLESMTR